jgi:mono/diheme cytochrome c family protein
MNITQLALSAALLAVACSADDESSSATPDPVARGRYIVNNVAACVDCHTPRDPDTGAPVGEMFLAGVECFVQLDNGSCLNSRNLTSHETGLANRTDAEIERMIRDGIRPAATGDEALFPVMPYYVFHNLSEPDLDAVVAYLRTVPPVDHAVPRSGPEFEVPAPANPLPLAAIPQPLPGYADRDAALHGRYLAAEIGICMECHTQHSMGSPDVLDVTALFAGGERYEIGAAVAPVSKNLTSDAETGLAEWSLDEIVEAIKGGTDRNGDGICPPMPSGAMAPFGGLTDADALDIAHYIKSLPPVVKGIDDVCTWPL